jgi:hypothetical protein
MHHYTLLRISASKKYMSPQETTIRELSKMVERMFCIIHNKPTKELDKNGNLNLQY